jgi:predicted dehydrogenase
VKKVRIGIIGCGAMSRYHGKAWTTETPKAQIVAICDTNETNLDRYQREVFDPVGQRPQRFTDFRQMLAKVDLDGVMIVTPHAHHYEQATAALDAGCHVLLEKPMVTDVEQARRLLKHAAASKCVLSIALQGSFSAEFAYIRNLRQRGELGEIVSVHGFVTQNWLETTRGTWRQNPALSGGGEAYDTGSHLFHAMLYLTGLRPLEVFAYMENRGAPVDINTAAAIRFEGGALGSVSICGSEVRFDESIHLSGTGGAVRTSPYGGRLAQWDAKGKPVLYPPVQPVPSMYQNFVDCILGRAETPCPPIWGLRQALLMAALYRAARTGHPVKVQPE